MEKDIKSLTKEDLLNPNCISQVFASITDENENELLSQLMIVATKYKMKTAITNEIRCWRQDKKLSGNDVAKLLAYDEDGFVKQTTQNYQLVFNSDERYKNLFGSIHLLINLSNLLKMDTKVGLITMTQRFAVISRLIMGYIVHKSIMMLSTKWHKRGLLIH